MDNENTTAAIALAFFVGMILAFGLVHITDRDTIDKLSPCETDTHEAISEDEYCMTWNTGNGKIVVGPKWMSP